MVRKRLFKYQIAAPAIDYPDPISPSALTSFQFYILIKQLHILQFLAAASASGTLLRPFKEFIVTFLMTLPSSLLINFQACRLGGPELEVCFLPC